MRAGIDILHVPYKGVQQGITDIIGGPPALFAEHLRKEMARWSEVAKRMGLKPPA
jgi:tripartite-type tricarboxylate transporter receptor subunit TctC